MSTYFVLVFRPFFAERKQQEWTKVSGQNNVQKDTKMLQVSLLDPLRLAIPVGLYAAAMIEF